MPPKAEITKEKVLNAAFEIVREQGFDALTARNIAEGLKCSTQPIYRVYGNMEEVKDDVYNKAVEFTLSYIKKYEICKPELSLEIGYLHFAKYEKQLFRTVYHSGHRKYELYKDKFIGEEMSAAFMRQNKRLNNITETKIKGIFFKFSICLIGIGTMINTGTLELDISEATEIIRDMYEAILLSEGISSTTN